MDNLDFVRCKSLNNIPQRKLQIALGEVHKITNLKPTDKAVILTAFNRYAESNIPIEYWSLKMDHFKGDPRLHNRYEEYTRSLKEAYQGGYSICFAGGHGLGKTMTITCVLKKAVEKGYSCLYTTLSDVVNVLTQGDSEVKFLARRELAMVDFLAVDEFDPRFMASDSAADLYARSLESILRARSQNRLPILMATNSPNPVESFTGTLKESIGSLMQGYIQLFVVAPGKDFRKEKP